MLLKYGFVELGSGQPLILLHGIGCDAETWQNQLQEFADNYHVIAVDLPGHGRSQSLPQMTFPALAQWLHEFLTTYNLDQAIIVGHSFGGMILQEYLATFGTGRITAVVLYGTSPAFGRKDGAWQGKFVRSRLQPLDDGQTMVELAPSIARGLVGSSASSAAIEMVQQGVAAVAEETFRASVLCLIDFDQRSNLGNINIPCLAIVGEEDGNAPPAMMEKMADYIPTAQFVSLPKVGHMAHLENPYLFNRTLKTFLQSDY